MKPSDARAIAEFLEQGGKIKKIQQPIAATEQEILDYLASCGVSVKYFPDVLLPYQCLGRRHNLASIVRMANDCRRSQKLSPFALTPRSARSSQSRSGSQTGAS